MFNAFATLDLVYRQNFSPIGASTSFDHIWASGFGPKIYIIANYLYRHMHYRCLSLHAKFQPDRSKYKF